MSGAMTLELAITAVLALAVLAGWLLHAFWSWLGRARDSQPGGGADPAALAAAHETLRQMDVERAALQARAEAAEAELEALTEALAAATGAALEPQPPVAEPAAPVPSLDGHDKGEAGR
ncbi:MAG: hypothetical protein AAF677_13555 [Pseudomonadota bacterium]